MVNELFGLCENRMRLGLDTVCCGERAGHNPPCREVSLQETKRLAIRRQDIPIIGRIVDARRKAGSTHWETYEFLNNIEPISKADYDEICREWEDDYPF